MTAENQERDARLAKLAGAIFLVSYAVSSWMSIQLYDPPLSEPFDNPPWYFIRQDAVMGLCFLPLFIAGTSAVFVAMRKGLPQTAKTLWGVGAFALQPVWQLLLIYLRTEELFDRAKASTSWPTFDSYLYDPWKWGWLVIVLTPLLIERLLEVRRRPKSALP